MEIEKVWFDDEHLFILLNTGSIIGQPIHRFKRLENASAQQRQQFQISRFKDSIHWEAIDEDLSLEGLLDVEGKMRYAKIL